MGTSAEPALPAGTAVRATSASARHGRLGAAAVALLALAALAGDPPARTASGAGPARTPEFAGRVDAAVARGVRWLASAQRRSGAFPDFEGYPGAVAALAYHTMRACGTPHDDEAARRAWSTLKRASQGPEPRTYACALYLMAIAAHGQRDAAATDERDVTLSDEDAKWAAEITRCLLRGRAAGGSGWGYTTAGTLGRTDNSNTQFALLGLKSAARCGVAVDASVWASTLTRLCAQQEDDGPETPRSPGGFLFDRARGWSYYGRDLDDARPSMTAGCVGSVVICRSELVGTAAMTRALDARSERAVWDGLAWIGRHWIPAAAPADLDLYQLYSVERAGVLAGVHWMGELDWYGLGAGALLDAQLDDGSWDGLVVGLDLGPAALAGSAPVSRVVGTCFALLFLARGTTPVHRGAVTQLGGISDIDFDEGAKARGRDLEDFLDLVLSRWRRAADAQTRSRLLDGATWVGPQVVEPLLARLARPDEGERDAAHALLRRATGLDFGFEPGALPEVREPALAKWREWWLGAKEKLVYDPASRRLAER